jgi:hypothetical protein
MGWRFRKALTFGPLRINLSKSGLTPSIGVPGFRISRKALTLGGLGTGLFWMFNLRRRKGKR